MPTCVLVDVSKPRVMHIILWKLIFAAWQSFLTVTSSLITSRWFLLQRKLEIIYWPEASITLVRLYVVKEAVRKMRPLYKLHACVQAHAPVSKLTFGWMVCIRPVYAGWWMVCIRPVYAGWWMVCIRPAYAGWWMVCIRPVCRIFYCI